MKPFAIAITIFVALIILDLFWFQLAGSFFKNQIGSIARLSPSGQWDVNLAAAVAVYILMAVGILLLVLPQTNSLGSAFLYGALFGLVTYGIFDFTNLAILSAWTLRFAVVDVAWGTLLCATTSALAYWLSQSKFFS